MYKQVIRRFFFALDPETAHRFVAHVGCVANFSPLSAGVRAALRVNDPRLALSVAGLRFENPIGLAAGFDKNGEVLGLWNAIGFGHIEVGTVSALPQPGNPRPRIFRFERDAALINRMGFPSIGAEAMFQRLVRVRASGIALPPLGINIGKSKVVELDGAIEDYCASFRKLASLAEYVTVNVSSPNTPGLRQLQDRDRLNELLRALQAINTDRKPIFLKVSPDLTFAALEEVVGCCVECGITGIIATNSTLGRDGLQSSTSEAGGLSGAPLTKRTLEVVRFLGSVMPSSLVLIGCGGVSNGPQLLAMLAAGARMVQIYTGLIYEGPLLIRRLNAYLRAFMDTHRCADLAQAAAVARELPSGL
jgi:dihydroorotate dehydrogenase